MIDLTGLVKGTNAYKIIESDKRAGKLSHAYLILCQDGENLNSYLKEIVKLLFCKSDYPCGECRACSLIEKGVHPDAVFLPRKGDAVLSEDVSGLIQDTFIKPYESDKKVFVINHGETMNAQSQNKLLKTLEEPPKNVHIIIGATSEYALLPTIKSRVKQIVMHPFDYNTLYNALKGECLNHDKLSDAINYSDGTLSKTLALYNDQNFTETFDFCLDLLGNMKSSSDVLEYSYKLDKLKCEFKEFLSVLEVLLRDVLVSLDNQNLIINKNKASQIKALTGYKRGALLAILDDVLLATKRLEANSSKNAVGEWLLFKILEEKFKWQKL